jgi:ribosomal protein L11 methyltransferase
MVVRPSWLAVDGDVNPDDVVLTLDPGMAFGTGLHPTTQSCLLALEDIVKPGMSVLDAGTGSGILAIAAARLGASEVAAFDTDILAVRAAGDNARLNELGDSLRIWQGELENVGEHLAREQWDIVVANILAPIIIQLLTDKGLMTYVAPQGQLILSGIVNAQGDGVKAALADAGGTVIRTIVTGDWVTYIAGHR